MYPVVPEYPAVPVRPIVYADPEVSQESPIKPVVKTALIVAMGFAIGSVLFPERRTALLSAAGVLVTSASILRKI